VLLFNETTVVGRKFAPTISSVVDGLPAGRLAGETDVITGNGVTTLNGWPAEVPPPGAEFVTVLVAFDAAARSAAVRDTMTCVALVNVVVLALPLKLAIDVGTKPLPVIVTVALDKPTVTVEGARLRSAGAGLSTLRVTVVLEVVPAPFVTATWSWAPEASWPAATVACNCVALTYTVVTWVLFTTTTLEVVKPLPVIVIVSELLPAGTLLGVIDWIASWTTGGGEVFWEEPEPPHPTTSRQKIAQ
jgi:hypothetical protein